MIQTEPAGCEPSNLNQEGFAAAKIFQRAALLQVLRMVLSSQR
jgi:hypothetical protein